MHWWQAVVFGMVEGLTEFLPVSSTGHLILTAKLLGLSQTEFLKTFEIAIQLGGVLAVAAVYWRSLLTQPQTLKRVAVAFIPTALIGFAFYPVVKKIFLSSETIVLWSLAVGGAVLILFDLVRGEKTPQDADSAPIPYSKCFWVGVIQALSVIPGVSRSGATIVGGLALGISRKSIVEFSFLLAVPVILAATVLDLLKSGGVFDRADWSLLWLGAGVSFTAALVCIRLFLRFVQNHGFWTFGVYRILVAAAFWLLVR